MRGEDGLADHPREIRAHFDVDRAEGRLNSKKKVFLGESCLFNVITSNPQSFANAT
jgi:hypothetical protein